jgi:AAA domain
LKILSKQEVAQDGRFMMVYGPTGVGKTTSLLQTVLDPIMYIQTEPRSLKPSLDAAGRPDLDIDVAVYEDWVGLIEFVAQPDNFKRHRSIVVDSYSHLMSVGLSSEIEDQAFEARDQKEKAVKPLASQTKLSQEGYGALSSLMFRLTAALGKLSQMGKIVIVTALLQESPKWNRELAAAPALKGREFPVNMPGFFDLIGLVEPRTDIEGKIVYPPRVRFQSVDDSFVAKFTGAGTRTQGPLDITKILNLSERS